MNDHPSSPPAGGAPHNLRPIPQATDPATLPAMPVDDMDPDEAVAFWRRRVRWREVAALMATGLTVNETARAMRIEPYRIRRNLVRSARFRRWIYEEQSALMEAARRKLAAVQVHLPAAFGEMVEGRHPGLLRWLAEELKNGDLGLDSLPWNLDPPKPAAGKPAPGQAPGQATPGRPVEPPLSNFDLGLRYLGHGISPVQQDWSGPATAGARTGPNGIKRDGTGTERAFSGLERAKAGTERDETGSERDDPRPGPAR